MRPCVLCILDGWGISAAAPDNSISEADLPVWSSLWSRFPHTVLDACGQAVGLPIQQMGNSEVGHMTLGSGRIIYQDLPRIDQALKDKSALTNPWLVQTAHSPGRLHLIGLVSDGGVHSHLEHLLAYADFFQRCGKEIVLHAFLDGRDCPPQSALTFLHQTRHIPLGTVSGRYYGMDRDQRWDRTEQAFQAIAHGYSPRNFSAYETYITQNYNQGVGDEFIPPAVHDGYEGLYPGDSLFFFNFRSDRVRQLLASFIGPDFKEFDASVPLLKTTLGMTDYGDHLRSHYHALYPPQKIQDTLGEIVSKQGLTQWRLGETEKYAHVTFFFNGGQETPFPGESRTLIPSPKVATYDLCPEMSAQALTDEAVRILKEGATNLIIMNYANPDMVGHTGNQKATIKALETVDACLGRLWQTVQEQGGILMITADHGNCEKMRDEHGNPHTAHTLNLVPFLLLDTKNPDHQLAPQGTLADIAPTLLTLMGIDVPSSMTGACLIK